MRRSCAGGRVAEDRELARRLARSSIVLLRNEGVLPLAAPLTIAVIGPSADSARNLQGDYSHLVHIESLIEGRTRAHFAVVSDPGELDVNGLLAGIPTILDTIRERAGAGSIVRYAARLRPHGRHG